jgi:hypothetical protein
MALFLRARDKIRNTSETFVFTEVDVQDFCSYDTKIQLRGESIIGTQIKHNQPHLLDCGCERMRNF